MTPARIVRVTSFDDDLFVLDEAGVLWSYERRYPERVHEWVCLPARPRSSGPLLDIYVHVRLDPDDEGKVDRLECALRILDSTNKLWQLRWCNGEYLWDEISLEAR